MSGYVKLHRKILDNPLFKSNPAARHVFMELLLRFQWKEDRQDWHGTEVVIERGSVALSTRELVQISGYSHQKVRTILNHLVKHQIVKINTPANRGPSVITACNYSVYQDGQHTVNTPSNTRPTHDQHTIKEGEETTTTNYSARSGEIEGLNGSTTLFVDMLANLACDPMSGQIPDREYAHQFLRGSVAVYDPQKVKTGMFELEARVKDGQKIQNVYKTASSFIKVADVDGKPRLTRIDAVRARNEEMAKAIENL